jgi:uncharacterized protein YceK
MKIVLLAMMALLALSGCSPQHSRLTGYNLKASVGSTDYQDGNRSIYTGATIDAHFDVAPGR